MLESPGGGAMFAMDLAEYANQIDKTIIFTGFCASACLDVLKFTNKVHVGKNAVFIAHSTSDERLVYIEQALRSSSGIEGLDIKAVQEGIAFSKALNPTFFTDERRAIIDFMPSLMTEMQCAGGIVKGRVDIGVVGRSFHVTKYDAWVLGKGDIERLKLNAPAPVFYAKDYDARVRSNMQTYEDFISPYKVIYSDEKPYDWDALMTQKENMLKNAKLCPVSER